MPNPPDVMEKLVSLCKRRGFIFQSSEIYGGLNSCYDYGPLGVELKRNVKEAWWRAMVVEREDVVGLDSAIIQHPKVWESSGHLKGFSDPLVDCKTCKGRYRADKLADYVCPWPEARHTIGCIKMAPSMPTMSSRSRTIAFHQASLTLRLSSTPSGP